MSSAGGARLQGHGRDPGDPDWVLACMRGWAVNCRAYELIVEYRGAVHDMLDEMNPEDLRAYARRNWRAAEMGKREHWAREVAERGLLATLEVSQALWEHVRGLRPDWPTPEERRADLVHHVALRRALDRAAGAFRSATQR